MIAISLWENPPHRYEEVSTLVFRKCMTAQYSIRSTVNTTLKHTPGELAFGRDMMLPFASKVDWSNIFQRKQDIIKQTNKKENSSRTTYDYEIGQRVLILNKNPHKGKLEATALNEGPWIIQQVHSNGTVTILCNKYHERMNIRRIRPFFE